MDVTCCEGLYVVGITPSRKKNKKYLIQLSTEACQDDPPPLSIEFLKVFTVYGPYGDLSTDICEDGNIEKLSGTIRRRPIPIERRLLINKLFKNWKL